jgi:sodium/proline symporter
MSEAAAILWTLVAYKVVMVAIGIAANRLQHDKTDFFLGGRRLGAGVAALSASASSSSVWTLIGVSGYAYGYGLSAVWIFPACVGGFCLNWFVLAPALRRHSHDTGAITVTEILAGPRGARGRRAIVVVASLIILVSLVTYVAAQFNGAGKALEETFGLSFETSVLIGSAIVIFYTLLGGFWAVSLTDSLQGLMMALASIILPLAALSALGGLEGLAAGIDAVKADGYASVWRGLPTAAGLGLALGLLGIGVGYPGQPHVVNRFMALKDESSVRRGRQIAIAWSIVLYAGMITLGLCARVLVPELADREDAFVAVTRALLHPVMAGVMLAAVLSAIMSTADSQLLVAASTISHDLARTDTDDPKLQLRRSRWTVLLLSVGAVFVALYATKEIFGSVLFAWSAMGSAFGPPLLVIVLGRRTTPGQILGAMVSGFCLSVLAYSIPETKGGPWERIAPWVVSLVIAAWPAAPKTTR